MKSFVVTALGFACAFVYQMVRIITISQVRVG